MKKIILALSFLLFAASALALECPDENVVTTHDDGTKLAFHYTCDDGYKTFYVFVPETTTDVESAGMLLGLTCVQKKKHVICR